MKGTYLGVSSKSVIRNYQLLRIVDGHCHFGLSSGTAVFGCYLGLSLKAPYSGIFLYLITEKVKREV